MIYLDNAATTQVSQMSKEVINMMLNDFTNPNSLYPPATENREMIEKSRRTIAESLGTEASRIIFTSGGSESNATAIKGVARRLKSQGKTHCITTHIEHSSVLECFKQLEADGFEVTYVSVGADPTSLTQRIKESVKEKTGLISVMAVNNETGMMLPVKQIGQMCKSKGILFHTDCVQAFGQTPISLDPNSEDYIPCNLLSVSGHKLHAPKGVGFLYSDVEDLDPLIPGHQEAGMRGGTENVPYIVSLSLEARSASAKSAVITKRSESLFKFFKTLLAKKYKYEYTINCDDVAHSPKIISLTLPGFDANTLVLYLATKGIYVSAGSACRSHEQEPSYVLKDLGLTSEQAQQTIRVSTSLFTSLDDMSKLVDALCSAGKII